MELSEWGGLNHHVAIPYTLGTTKEIILVNSVEFKRIKGIRLPNKRLSFFIVWKVRHESTRRTMDIVTIVT
jgi:hypothetical protein